MHRRSLFHLPLVASALGGSPLEGDGTPGDSSVQPPDTPTFVAAGADRDQKPIVGVHAIYHVKVSGKDTEGRCLVLDTLRPTKVGPSLHLHTDCDEWFFVRDGEFKFKVGEDIMRLKAGDSLLVPRNIAHAFVKTSEGVGKLIVMHQPAVRMEEFFRSVDAVERTPDGRRTYGEQFGMRFVGPPLTAD